MKRGMVDRVWRWLFGPPEQVALTITHCVHSAAETFFTVSMAGSIFFSVSPEAARPRVLLFLALTLGPFLVMAPLIGPVVDRVRGGLSTTMVLTFPVRAVLAFLLAQNLRTLLLFPLAFGMLVVAKTYTVSRNALVPSIVADADDLVSANSRLARTATFAGTIAGAAAITLFSVTSAVVTLLVAAGLYVVGMIAAWQVRRVARPLTPMGHDAVVELERPDVSGAVWDMMALRAAIGFAVFQFAFSIRAAGDPPWVFGAVLMANGLGGFTGTVVSPTLRKHLSERAMFTSALVASSSGMAVCGLALNRFTLIGSVYVLGLSVSVGRRALDATIQRLAPHAQRGQVYASLETRLELAWVVAACLAVGIRVDIRVGIAALAVFLAVVTVVHVRRSEIVSLLRPIGVVALADRLLMRAETLTERGYHDEAIILARAATEAARGRVERVGADPRVDAAAAIERARRLVDAAHRGSPVLDDDVDDDR